MFWKATDRQIRVAANALAIVALTATAFFWSGNYLSAEAQDALVTEAPNAPSATFNANAGTLGLIPDGLSSTTCPNPGAAKNITFTVSGLTTSPAAVSVSMTFGSPFHTWVGDISAFLIAPNGATHFLFSRTGATTATSSGDSSDLNSTYVFADNTVPDPSGGWWQEANLRGAAEGMTAGTYKATAGGGAGQINPAAATDINPAFSSVANANGTWTLRLIDNCGGDTGGVTAASLTITPTLAQHAADFNGDGKTDYSIARPTSGNIVWYTYDGVSVLPAGFTANTFGLTANDHVITEDFDGDNKSDITVWREGVGGVAAFYILQSSNGTFRVEPFGKDGDDPAVVGDYDGDNKADPAVFRCPAFDAPPGQCFYYYKGSLVNAGGGYTAFAWGFGRDGDLFPYIGDFDGDGKNDFCIQRENPTSMGAGQFILYRTQDGGIEFHDWGLSSDFLIPGDYDGDGKTDICVRRTTPQNLRIHYIKYRTGNTASKQWGIAGDSSAPGDYDGDGRTDLAVWRGSSTPGQSTFYVENSGSGTFRSVQWGQCPTVGTCDFAVAGWPVH